jgi:hypothetical protein
MAVHVTSAVNPLDWLGVLLVSSSARRCRLCRLCGWHCLKLEPSVGLFTDERYYVTGIGTEQGGSDGNACGLYLRGVRDTDYPEMFCGFTQSLQANAGIVFWNGPCTRALYLSNSYFALLTLNNIRFSDV